MPHPPPAQAKELTDHLEDVLSNMPLEVAAGATIVEIKPQGVSKGTAVEAILERAAASESASAAAAAAAAGSAANGGGGEDGGAGDAPRRVRFAEAPGAAEFVLCIGNDRSDEDMFAAVEAHAVARQDSCKVRRGEGGERAVWLRCWETGLLPTTLPSAQPRPAPLVPPLPPGVCLRRRPEALPRPALPE
jgi:trehalose-phosphatase